MTDLQLRNAMKTRSASEKQRENVGAQDETEPRSMIASRGMDEQGQQTTEKTGSESKRPISWKDIIARGMAGRQPSPSPQSESGEEDMPIKTSGRRAPRIPRARKRRHITPSTPIDGGEDNDSVGDLSVGNSEIDDAKVSSCAKRQHRE